MAQTAEELIAALGLVPLEDEGGWHRCLWRAEDDVTVSAIYYLLKKGERSRWHQLKSNEIWTWHAGGSLEMTLGGDGPVPTEGTKQVFGPRIGVDQGFLAVAPAHQWQTTHVVDGDFALVSCVVSPAFRPEDCYLPHPPIEEDLR